MPKHKLGGDSETPSRSRVHAFPESGPLYIANMSTLSVLDDFKIANNSASLDDPKVFIDRKSNKSKGIGASFSRSRAFDDSEPSPSATIVSNLSEGQYSENLRYRAVKYTGSTEELSAVDKHRRLYVAFLNKRTRKLSVVPAKSVCMRPVFEPQGDEEQEATKTAALNTPDGKRQSVQELTMAFGSDRKKKALKSANERKSLATDAVNSAIEVALQEAKSAPTTPSTSGSGTPNDLEAALAFGEEFDIGNPHLDAGCPSEVFPLSRLVSEEQLSSLQPVNRTKESELPVLVRRCFSSAHKPSDALLKLLNYLHVLVDMHKAKGVKVKRGDLIPRFIPLSLRNELMNRFLVSLAASADAKQWAMPPRLRTRLLVHIMLIGMHAYCQAGNNFAINVSDLQTDLALAPRTLLSAARQFGCSTSGTAGGLNVISIPVPYKPPAAPTLKGPSRRR